MCYFLYSAIARRHKNPNELYCFYVLSVVQSIIFLHRLSIDFANLALLRFSEKVLSFFSLVIVFMMLLVMALCFRALRDQLFDEVTWDIGLNQYL